MTQYTAMAIMAIVACIAFLVVIQRMHHYKKLREEWIREMNAQAENPFNKETGPKESPDSELVSRS